MKRIYLLIVFIGLCMASNTAVAQQANSPIDGLSIYPNPATTGIIYVTTSLNHEKSIIIYDVLGNIVLNAKLAGKELDITTIESGIYIIKIEEDGESTTRKLVIR